MKLSADNISCVRGERMIFSGISLTANAGELVGLFGPNGSGKTTLLRVIAGFIPPFSGRIQFVGKDAEVSEQEMCHYVGHLNGVKPQLSVEENLCFYRDFLGGGDIEPVLDLFSLFDIRHLPASVLSAGQGRRLGLARLLVAPRPIWLLDEPTVSLDTQSAALLASLISAHLDDGGIVVAATHVPLGVDMARRLSMGQASQSVELSS